ncbi:HK97 family phage major capsid protein/HK97 family phage prohead protease [Rhizobium sp. SG_E_25_P2]|uniref:phage major capsid protein n=1 Tax=Rhizobium sp. SG_E_25_P2 TaxID=2879942 RepID=UPI002475AB29|nr:phage major capsid protein [Rhizobium sp. SG_E_25_P2]MDH6265637.1 HK97 family phage major capsid protein/HK97 family phage prohead protease [Rhizobium sp. SG_E_25_P2]
MTGADNLIIKGEFSIDEAGTVTGIAWPFDTVDTQGDRIEKGAFKFAADVPMFMEHQEGAIGIWDSFKETDAGLEVTGRLFLESSRAARAAYDKLRKGLIDGLSVSGIVTAARMIADGVRSITDTRILEISLCRRPVNPGARVTIVKSLNEEENMKPEEIQNEPETNSDPVATPDELKLLKARMDAIEAKASRLRGVNNNNASADNDNEEVKAFFDGLRSTGIQKALTTATGASLIPSALMNKVIVKLMAQSPVRRFANVITVEGPSIEVPSLVTDVTIGEVTETSPRPESSPEFGSKFLRVFESSVIVPITRQMLEDSAVMLESFFVNRLAQGYAEKEQSQFIGGNGTTQAEGILTAAEVQAPITTASSTAFTADELIELFYSLKSAYRDNGVWLMHSKSLAKLRQLTDASGTHIWQSSLAAGQPDLLLGRPVFAADHMPNPVAGATPIVFGDIGEAYTIVDRVRPSIEWDYQTGFSTGLVKGNTRARFGGGVVNGEAIVKLKMKA